MKEQRTQKLNHILNNIKKKRNGNQKKKTLHANSRDWRHLIHQ